MTHFIIISLLVFITLLLFKKIKGRKEMESVNEVNSFEKSPIEISRKEKLTLYNAKIPLKIGHQIKELSNAKIIGLYKTYPLETYKEKELRGVQSIMDKNLAINVLEDLKTIFKNENFKFYLTNHLSDYSIAVISTNDRYEVLEILETNGVNWDFTTKDIITKFRHLESYIDFEIVEVRYDKVKIRFKSLNFDIEKFYNECKEFCPDTFTDFDTVKYWIEKDKTYTFWWG